MDVKLSDRLEGKELTFRDGALVVKIKPLGNIIAESIRDKALDYTDEDGQQRIRVNVGHQSLLIVAHGIESVALDGKAWPMECVKLMGRQYYHLRFSCLDDFSRHEFGVIGDEIAGLSNLEEPEKNSSASPSDSQS